MKALSGLALLASVIWFTSGERTYATDADSWKDRFLKEAPARWQEYQKDGAHLQGTWVATSTMKGKITYRVRAEFKQNKNCALVQTDNQMDKNRSGVLYGINSRYGFQLHRQSPEKPWVIVGKNLDLTEGYKLHITSPKEAVQNWLGSAFNINGTANAYLPEVIGDPDFSVKKAVTVVRDGRTLVRVEFSARPKEYSSKSHPRGGDWRPLRGGWLLLDPEHYWVLRECEVQMQRGPETGSSTETVRGTFDYTESPKGFPILKSIVRTWADAKYTQEFDLTERNDVPDSEFTLSAFGLPEPAELQGKPSRVRWYLWAGVAGICCLALGAGFHWRSKRRVA